MSGAKPLPRPAARTASRDAAKPASPERLSGPALRTFFRIADEWKLSSDEARTLLGSPPVLILDEPTLGLDVQSRLRIWDYVRQLKARGITIVMTTNYLDEADQLCDRLAIIDGGRIRAMGSPSELKAGLGGDIVSLTIGAADAGRTDALAAALRALPRQNRPSEVVVPGLLEGLTNVSRLVAPWIEPAEVEQAVSSTVTRIR